jgi:hypothetical protein
MRRNPYIQAGLRKASFRGGWLDTLPKPPPQAQAQAQPATPTHTSEDKK